MFLFRLPEIDWSMTLPIAVVVVTGMLALIVEMLAPKRNNNLIVATCVVGLLAALGLSLQQIGKPDAETLSGMLVRDGLGTAMNVVLILTGLLCLLFSEGYLREKRVAFGEFYPLMLWSLSGGMVMATSRNLLTIFIGLELLSIALYVMAGLSRKEERSEESAMKYFLLGAFASGFLLYGMAFIYGASGSLHLTEIFGSIQAAGKENLPLFVFGAGLMLIGLGFKCAFVPFHQWTPDVYQGAPTNVTAFMAAASKVGAFAALIRVLDGLLPLAAMLVPALSGVAILTMVAGNLMALAQKDAKRILAYSSIAHSGYILVGVLAHVQRPDLVNSTAVVYYLLGYGLMTVGAFAVLSLASKNGLEDTSLESLRGLKSRSPFIAGALALFMFSLMGIPPTAGFFGKYLIFNDAVTAGLTPLAVLLAVGSIISIYYYLSIVVAALVSEEEDEGAPQINPGARSAALICSVGVVAAAIFFSPITSLLGLR